jgi:hypothetical protein
MDHNTYLWYPAYFAAVCETNDELMPGRVLEALAAIEQRLLAPIEPGSDELGAIYDAQNGLQTLKTERVMKPPRPDAAQQAA